MTSYRYPNEHLVLFFTLLLVGGVILLTAVATFCGSFIFVILVVVYAYGTSRSMHHSLLQRAYSVENQTAPALARIVQQCAARLRPGPVQVFAARSRDINAYTFGLSSPKIVVLYTGLLEIMDEAELRFVIGHEMGHVALGHTWLNSLVGGLSGIPSGGIASTLLTLAFLAWNRTCELSADRAGMLACGDPEKAVSALVKLVAGPAGRTRAGLELAYRQIDAEDDTIFGSLNEVFGSHPMLIRRINELRRYARSAQYQRLFAEISRQA